MSHRRYLALLSPLLLASLFGCSPSDTDDAHDHVGHGIARAALAHPGPWDIPDATLAIGDTQYVDYTGAGPWVGESGCGGDILSGTDILRDYLYAHFPQSYSIGGYSCRPINGNPSQMSVHATGRALDIMLPTDDGEADNDFGDPIGNWLIENAEVIGIQYIIWDLYTWNASKSAGSKDKSYGGAHPHHDHLHIELSVAMADNTTNWFEDAVDDPAIIGCDAIEGDGAIIDEQSLCFFAFGPTQFWRLENGAGHEDSLIWTNAFENDSPSNWARWNLMFASEGEYTVEVYVDETWGTHQQTPYFVRHADGDDLVIVDQSIEHGWVSLGDYRFDTAPGQFVDVYDNVEGPVEADQHIAVDAARVTRLGAEPPTTGPGTGTGKDPTDPGNGSGTPTNPAAAEEDGGCSVSAVPASSGQPGWVALLLMALGLTGLRRRR